MSEQEHDLLSQYLDGELGPHQVKELERRLAADQSLQTRLSSMRHFHQSMVQEFNALGSDRVPNRISSMLEAPVEEAAVQTSGANVVAFPARQKANWGFAIAASLLAASGLLFLDQTGPDPVGTSIDPVIAQQLESAASDGAAWTTLNDGRKMRTVLTFRTKNHGWCREYLLTKSNKQHHAVACRADQQWVNAVDIQTDIRLDSTASDYRPAGSSDSQSVSQFSESQADGIPLSLQDEAALIAKGWN